MHKAINYKINDRRKYFGFAFLAFLAFLAAGCSPLGTGALDKAAEVNKNSSGLALDGYDAVAYFTENLPREGKPEFVADYNGAKWQFTTAENRDAFFKDPAKYAPQYGGLLRVGGFARLHGGHRPADRQSRGQQTLFKLQP